MSDANTTKKSAYDLKGIRVLVVEDFPFMADLISAMLKEFNVGKVLSTCSAREARETLSMHNINTQESMHIDLVITDLLAPKMEGIKLMEWIRSHQEESVKFIPILFCSAHTTLKVVTSGRDTGANEIMVKPISAEKLAHRLLHIIDRPRPYVKAPHFFGPDRRRKADKHQGAERRLTNPDSIKVNHESEAA